MVSPFKDFIMKKLVHLILATCFMLSVIPSQIKAATDAETAKTVMISSETTDKADQLSEIKSIELNKLSTSENNEVLKESSPSADVQGRRNGWFNNRRNKNLDLTIQADNGNRRNNNGVYLGGAGLLVLIILLILIL